MIFSSCHRFPTAAEGPRPIIVRFVSFEDRETVYSKFLMPVLRDEKKRILTDLPLELKIKRSKLAKEAFKIRKDEGVQTRIQEKCVSVYLEVRKSKTDSWKKRDI